VTEYRIECQACNGEGHDEIGNPCMRCFGKGFETVSESEFFGEANDDRED
jgi:DnaJ-class molecular chaperone